MFAASNVLKKTCTSELSNHNYIELFGVQQGQWKLGQVLYNEMEDLTAQRYSKKHGKKDQMQNLCLHSACKGTYLL
jgi:hypothetical protein